MLHHQSITTTTVPVPSKLGQPEPVPALSPAKTALLAIQAAPPGKAPTPAELHRISCETGLKPRQVRALVARYLVAQHGLTVRDVMSELGVAKSEVYRYLSGLTKANAQNREAVARHRERRRECDGGSPVPH